MKKVIENFLAFFSPTKVDSVENFFDYPSYKKKKMIKESARRAGQMQRDLVKEYKMAYCSK